jgi:hypothetical protein
MVAAKRTERAKGKAGKSRVGVTLADVRRAALALPDTEERPSYGTPGFRVRDKLFARVLDDEALVVKVDLAWRDAIVAGSPDVFYVTPHYQGYPWVVVRLGAIDRARLRDVLAEAWQLAAPRKGAGRAQRNRKR